jgi:hypothetical protein
MRMDWNSHQERAYTAAMVSKIRALHYSHVQGNGLRYALWCLACLVLALCVHLIVILAIPYLAPKTPMQRLAEAYSGQGVGLLPSMLPDQTTILCRPNQRTRCLFL